MPNGFDILAEGVGKAVKTVPEVYEDGLKPATKESGKTIALIPRAINAALVPLRQWIAVREYNIAETEKLLSEKLEHVGQDKIVTSEPYVAIPAIQAISYSMNSEELRNLYANLLTKSMINDSKNSVHPSFVEIIKQMSPLDATVFQMIMKAKTRPLITLNKQLKSGGSIILQRHCSWVNELSVRQFSTSIDSLIRLGLIEIPYGEYYNIDATYNAVKQNPLFKTLEHANSILLENGEKLEYDKQYIKINDLSSLFYEICVVNP
ncbi:DUF4393 domain-containing protein [Lacrimispora sp. AGF001]|uniref:DUF4393 domain-containing protein n=1 Tax=Lacrimispora sp. AGF001 TaxID=3401631 RepID=UPI003B434E33